MRRTFYHSKHAPYADAGELHTSTFHFQHVVKNITSSARHSGVLNTLHLNPCFTFMAHINPASPPASGVACFSAAASCKTKKAKRRQDSSGDTDTTAVRFSVGAETGSHKAAAKEFQNDNNG